MNRRTTRRLAAVSLAALVAVGLGGADALAGKAARKARLDLEPPAAAVDQDALGVVRVKRRKTGDRIVISLRRLDPKTLYEVRDLDTDAVLGRVLTNRKGKARLKVRMPAEVLAKGEDETRAVADGVVVIDPKGETVLRVASDDGARPDDERGEGTDVAPGIGFATYGERDATHGTASLLSIPDVGLESIGVTLEFPVDWETDEAFEINEFHADTLFTDEGGLPLGVESVRELAGRAFRIVDLRGDVVLRDVLPELEVLRLPDFPGMPRGEVMRGPPMEMHGTDTRMPESDMRMPPMGDGWMDDGRMGGPWGPEALDPHYFLLIADDAGEFVRVGPLDRYEIPIFRFDGDFDFDWDFDFMDCPRDGGHDRPPPESDVPQRDDQQRDGTTDSRG